MDARLVAALSAKYESRSRQWAKAHDNGLFAYHIVDDFVPPAHVVGIGFGFAIEGHAEHEVFIAEISGFAGCEFDKWRIGECWNAIGRYAAR